MVDVFISYSQADRPHVEKLEAELNAHGYSTWWDKKLERGDDFSKTIDRHLKDAKIVICLWSETSVESDWVRAEAEKARSLGKLLPARVKGLSYDRIPPPFNILDTGELAPVESLINSIRARLADPEFGKQSSYLIVAGIRREILSWMGIVGGIVTVASNLNAVFKIATWADWLFANWLEAVSWFWRTVLFFIPSLSAGDASLLTILLFLTMSVLACLRRGKARSPAWAVVGSCALAALIVGSIFASAFSDAVTGQAGLTGLVFDWMWLNGFAPVLGVDVSQELYPRSAWPLIFASSVSVLAIGTFIFVAALRTGLSVFRLSIDQERLLRRLAGIVLGVLFLGSLVAGVDLLTRIAA